MDGNISLMKCIDLINKENKIADGGAQFYGEGAVPLVTWPKTLTHPTVHSKVEPVYMCKLH